MTQKNSEQYYEASLVPGSREPCFPVTDLGQHQKGSIASVRGDSRVVQRLTDLGLTPGTTITLLKKIMGGGPVTIVVRQTTLALDRSVAQGIALRPCNGGRP